MEGASLKREKFLKGLLLAKGRELGVKIGVTTGEPFWEMGRVLQERQRAGLVSPFEAKDLEKRYRPELSLPGVQSIIAVAVPYNVLRNVPQNVLLNVEQNVAKNVLQNAWRDAPQNEWPMRENDLPNVPRGVAAEEGDTATAVPAPWWPSPPISLHALGEDYHRVVRAVLLELVAALQESLENEGVQEPQFLLQVDTGPLVEREAARRAGVGWIGSNASLFVPGFGSWVYLGLILTTLRLPPDQPLQVWRKKAEHWYLEPVSNAGLPNSWADCHFCGRCVAACPTGALEQPYQLNPARCLSQWTQVRGLVPEGFRRALGRRLYGCDTCQLACPLNAALLTATPASGPDSASFLRQAFPSPVEILQLTDGQFQRQFGSTAAGWRGRRVFQRNALIALGNELAAASGPPGAPGQPAAGGVDGEGRPVKTGETIPPGSGEGQPAVAREERPVATGRQWPEITGEIGLAGPDAVEQRLSDWLAILLSYLDHPQAELRAHAAWALGQLRPTTVVVDALTKAEQREEDETVRQEITKARLGGTAP